MKRCGLLLITFLLVACVNVPIAEGIPEEDAIKVYHFTCDEPFELTRDCSSVRFAVREITIGELEFKVAGSRSGDVVLVQAANPFANCMVNDFFLANCPTLSRNTNAAYAAIRELFAANQIAVARVRPLISAGNIVAYYLEVADGTYDTLLRITRSGAEKDSKKQ